MSLSRDPGSKGGLAWVSGWVDAVLGSYSSILFSRRRIVGALLLLSTSNDPMAGWTGLAGVLLALGFARWMGFAPESWRQGFLSFNALLSSLGVSFLFSFTWQTAPLYVLLLVLVSLLSVMVTVSLDGIFRTHLALPVFSIPFVLVTLGLCLVSVFITGHAVTPPERSTILADPAAFPELATLGFKSLGNLFFQNNVWSGALVLLALCVESRISLLLAVLGFLECLGILNVLTFGEGARHIGPIGFNSMLTAIVLGGVLLIPSPASFLLAMAGVAFSVFAGAALGPLLHGFGISPLTLPFNASALLLLYAMRFRTVIRPPYAVDFIPGSPEENLEYHHNRLQRLGLSSRVSMRLPFLGTWTVTQPPDSMPTHQPPWQHAWDFEVTGPDSKTCRDPGGERSDYFAYDLPVTAPADGTVAQVVDHVPDNAIGHFNAEQNWGNLVMVWHGQDIHSLVSHLRPGSVIVKPGEIVRQGQLLGRCGNSGRSPVPHLHFHVQRSPRLSFPTCPSEFVRYIEETPEGDVFRLRGAPGLGSRLRDFVGDDSLASLLRLQVGEETRLQVRMGERQFREDWRVNMDLYGNLFLESSRGAKLHFLVGYGLYTAFSFSGARDSALFGFFLAASRIPFTGGELGWEDSLPSRYLFHPLLKSVADVFTPFGEPHRLHCQSRITREKASGEEMAWTIHTTIQGRFLRRTTAWPRRHLLLSFSKTDGITNLQIRGRASVLLDARRAPISQPDGKTP